MKKKRSDKDVGRSLSGAKKVAASVLKAEGRETWIVRTQEGRMTKISTTPSSAASMDRAVKRYAGALDRLAKK
jgi:hypothetical protein